MAQQLSVEQEAEARALADAISQAGSDDILALARLLVSKPSEQAFGQTESQLRDLVHRLGAKALELRLAGKKTRIVNATGHRGSA
jgi:hypothetical protein